jgi:predicted ATPase
MGNEFYVEVLSHIIPEDELVESIDKAISARFINELETTYRFNHCMIREVIYENLSQKNKQIMHRYVGEIIEELDENAVEMLSEHFYLAKIDDKTLKYSLRAADKANERGFHKVAVEFYKRALEFATGNKKSDILTKLRNLPT